MDHKPSPEWRLEIKQWGCRNVTEPNLWKTIRYYIFKAKTVKQNGTVYHLCLLLLHPHEAWKQSCIKAYLEWVSWVEFIYSGQLRTKYSYIWSIVILWTLGVTTHKHKNRSEIKMKMTTYCSIKILLKSKLVSYTSLGQLIIKSLMHIDATATSIKVTC